MIGAIVDCHGLPVMALRINANTRKATHITGADVQPSDAPDDGEAEKPYHRHRPEVVTPLDAEERHGLRREKQHRADTEVRWIPQVAALHPEHVLRQNRDKAGEEVRPQERGPHENADADPRDIIRA